MPKGCGGVWLADHAYIPFALWMLWLFRVRSHIRSHMTSHYTWGSVQWPHYMISEVSWDGLWKLSFGLSQFHGHGSWLVCEVTLRLAYNPRYVFKMKSLCKPCQHMLHISKSVLTENSLIRTEKSLQLSKIEVYSRDGHFLFQCHSGSHM